MKRQFLCVLCLLGILIGCQKTEPLGQSVPIEPSQSPTIQTELPTPTQEAAEFDFPEGEILFSDLLPEEWNELIITISNSSCRITIKPTKEYAERFLDSIKDQEIYSEFEPLHAAGGQVVVLSVTEDNGREYRFRDSNAEITVSIDSVSKIYGTEKNGEYRDILLDASTLFFMKDYVDFYKLNIVPLLIEKEEYQITGEYLDLWIPAYENIKDVDFAALGLTAYENGEEITRFSEESGTHHIVFENENGLFQMMYWVQ